MSSTRVGVRHVVTEEPEREHPPSARAIHTTGAVEREHVEEDGVARLELPADDLEGRAVALDVGQLVERAVREPLRLVVHEGAGHEPRPEVRACDELERRRTRDRIDGSQTEHVVVVEAHAIGPHQLAGDRSGRRRANDLLELGQALPVAEVLEKPPRITRATRNQRSLARPREVRLDRRFDEIELLSRERGTQTAPSRR